MNRTIAVLLGDAARRVGTLRFEMQGARQSAAFEYDAEWLARADVFALEPNLPLVRGMQFHKRVGEGSVFHNVIADTEPDGWARRVILRDYAKRRQEIRATGATQALTVLNPVDFLLAVDDENRVGALRFQDEKGIFQRAAGEGRRTAPPLVELVHLMTASRAVEMNTETAADLAYLRGRGTSLGGLRPKCSVIDDNGMLSIGKFPSVSDDRAVTKGEVLALRLARSAGIDASEARVIDSVALGTGVRYQSVSGPRTGVEDLDIRRRRSRSVDRRTHVDCKLFQHCQCRCACSSWGSRARSFQMERNGEGTLDDHPRIGSICRCF